MLPNPRYAVRLLRRRVRPGTIRGRILDLLHKHPEGLTAVEIRVYLGVDKGIGDVLQGMVRQHLIVHQDSNRKGGRYLDN